MTARGRWAHQAREFQIGRDKRARALIWPMRSGKSMACIDKACYQYSRGNIEGVIIIAPNGVHENWIRNEVPRWAWPDVEHRGFAWRTPERMDPEHIAELDALLAHGGMKWLAVNMEALKHPDNRAYVNKFITACHRKFMVIVSEAHHFGRPGAKRTYFARSLSKCARFVTIESGTPLLNSILRAFSQYELLGKKALGFETYGKFAERYAITKLEERKGSRRKFPRVVGYQNTEELRERISKWSSVVLREEIQDMPPLLPPIDRPIIMSDLQRQAYLELVAKNLLEINGTEIVVPDAGARMQKLQQILNGYIMKDGTIHTIDADAPIYDALIEQVSGTLPGKTIVWCRFREDIRRCVAKLNHASLPTLEFHGGVPLAQREPIRLEFQNPKSRKVVLVGQPQAGGEGRDFSAADAIVYFSSLPNAIAVAQSQERGTKVGGMPTAIVRLRTYGTVDDRNWQIVEGKFTMADTVSGRGLRDLLLSTDV